MMKTEKFSKTGRKILVGTLAASMCLSTTAWAGLNHVFDTEAYLTGDVNNNQNVDLEDAQLVLKYALGIETPDELAKAAADVDYNGKIELQDAQKVLKVALGIEKFDAAPSITPSESPVPSASAKPSPVAPSASTVPTVVPSPTPVPTGKPLPTVEPGTPVTGTSIEAVDETGLNGATVENGIYTFTDANKSNEAGVQMSNPWVGKTELTQTVIDALPSFFEIPDGVKTKVIAKINGNDLLALDGSKTVIGSVVSGETVSGTSVAVVSGSAVGTSEDAVTVTGAAMKWNTNMTPSDGRVEDKYRADYAETYARPDWNTGVSISFWEKADWINTRQTDAAPFLVIRNCYGCDHVASGQYSKAGHNGDYAFMLRLNGGVSFEGDTTGNCFKATNYLAGNNNEWNYYTVTFSNDWIAVYVNGQELSYYAPNLDKDYIKYFNDGFMTRYSPVAEFTKAETVDERGYLDAFWKVKNGVERVDVEATLIGNSRYANPGAVVGEELLMNLLTSEHSEIWFGAGSFTKCNALNSSNTGFAKYTVTSGTQFAGAKTYDKELTAAEIAANYEVEKAENAEKLGLNAE